MKLKSHDAIMLNVPQEAHYVNYYNCPIMFKAPVPPFIGGILPARPKYNEGGLLCFDQGSAQ